VTCISIRRARGDPRSHLKAKIKIKIKINKKTGKGSRCNRSKSQPHLARLVRRTNGSEEGRIGGQEESVPMPLLGGRCVQLRFYEQKTRNELNDINGWIHFTLSLNSTIPQFPQFPVPGSSFWVPVAHEPHHMLLGLPPWRWR
jgi:hypothetical protein